MSTTQPIRQLNDIAELKNYFLTKGEIRNYVLITLGLNTSLRISDILKLQWKDVYNFETRTYKKHVTVIEQKTGKCNTFILNRTVIDSLELLKDDSSHIFPDLFLILSRRGTNKPICRTRAFHIIKNAAQELCIEGVISCHSLRKTFGYQAWKQGVPPAVIMAIYNHSSIEITKRYLSIDQDDKDEVFLNLNL